MRGVIYTLLILFAGFQWIFAQPGESLDSLYLRRLDLLEKRADNLEQALKESRERMVTYSQFVSILRSINKMTMSLLIGPEDQSEATITCFGASDYKALVIKELNKGLSYC